MKPVYMIGGGITKFSKSSPQKDFRYMAKEAFDQAMADVPNLTLDMIDGSVVSYFSDHFTRQLMAGIMVQDYLGLTPKPSRRIESGGATGGMCIQSAWEAIASGRMDVCLAIGFETMSHVNTWKGNEFIALASDTNFDYPVGGFYTGYYAMMVKRHMYEFGTTERQLAAVSVKNHGNALHNPYAQFPAELTIEDVLNSEMIADPLKRLDICVMSDGAAAVILASEEMAYKLTDKPVRITGVGTGTDAMRLSDRPSRDVILLPHEKAEDYKDLKYPGVHSFRGGRVAAKEAYKMAGITNPLEEIDFVELHDAFTSSEIQTYEDLGLCKYGDGGKFVESGAASLGGKVPVNPSGGLLACGHPVGASGLMQGVFALWQLQGTIGQHFGGDDTLQIRNAKRGLIHSHAGTGTYITVSVMERGF
ncbi:MAG: thiolase domain-containing protein [Desulfitobacteriaceae bacterium]|nr:thiolase domain-containing protein [Desulfitobacteriaceae bacterium]MDI6878809.1 thiolase domain-containing protein [Desulfitobacteriaceae bacterium]MDI6914212.1 thiolase domain-containing protein [Desulfitobacteriaceae bacterium]MDI6914219.1 thiolase domain-containing protein [Desulfitobacteriaceae bacterium]